MGLRFGEASALRRRSVDLLHRRLRVDTSLAEVGGMLIFGPTKSHAALTVPLPTLLAASIDRHLERIDADPDASLFTSVRGRPLRYSRFRPTVWVLTLEKLGLPKTGMHVVRH